MRTTMFVTCAAAAVFTCLGACNWTEFDDLATDTWVDSTVKPDVKSADYGVAIQRGADASESAQGGTLAVIGAGPGSYSELAYSAAGSASLSTTTVQLAAQGILTLDSPPIFLASPTSSEVALVTTGDNSSIVVATGSHTLLVRQLFTANTNLGTGAVKSTTPDAATYMRPVAFPGGGADPGPAPIVAVGDVVMGTIYALPMNTQQPACKLTDGGSPIQVRALGAVPNATTPAIDDLLVWNGADGKLLRYDGRTMGGGNVFNGCTTKSPIASTSGTNTPAHHPGRGSQILAIDQNHVLLQGHDVTQGDAGFLQVYDVQTMAPVGIPITTPGLRSAAILTPGTENYVLAGYPSASVDGKTAGQVQVYKLTAGGIESSKPLATLHDAQPENNQQFGRSVAALPFNDTQVIAVAADNEIFVYFRANQTDGPALYTETRQGR